MDINSSMFGSSSNSNNDKSNNIIPTSAATSTIVNRNDMITNRNLHRPMKVIVFIDGTWLLYSLILGRHNHCPVQKKFGPKWQKTHRVDYLKMMQIIATNINSQVLTQSNQDRLIDVVKTIVFTSTRLDTPIDSLRANMITDFNNANFEVHRLVTSGVQEKCVDISLAVEMLYLATIPDAYDVAVVITGDGGMGEGVKICSFMGMTWGCEIVLYQCYVKSQINID